MLNIFGKTIGQYIVLQFLKIEISAYNIVLVLGVQYNDMIFVYIVKVENFH